MIRKDRCYEDYMTEFDYSLLESEKCFAIEELIMRI